MRHALLAVCVFLSASVAAAQDAPDYDALVSEAHQHTRAGRHKEAEEALERAIAVAETDQERAAAILALAKTREQLGNVDGATEALERARELEGGGHWLRQCLQRLGWLASRHDRTDQARGAWERLVEVLGEDDPQVGAALIGLARIEREAGQLEAATEHLRALLAHDSHEAWHREARQTLASVLMAEGTYEQALEVAREIERLPYRRQVSLRIGNRLLDAGKPGRAGEIGWEILADSPGYMPAMRLVHEAAVQAGTADALREKLREDAEGDEPEAALRFLAEAARWEGDAGEALTHLRRLAELLPDDAEVRVDLAETALDAERLDEAESALREALQLAPEHRGAQRTLAEVLVERGKTDEAIALLKEACGYDPAEPNTVQSLDRALSRHSLHHARVEAIERAREVSGDDGLMAYEMARAYIDLLRYEEATGELLKALDQEGTPARSVGVQLERLVTDEIAGETVLAAVRRHLSEADALSDAERLALSGVLMAAGDRETAVDLLAEVTHAGSAVADMARQANMRGDEELAVSLFEMSLEMQMPEVERANVALSLARLQRERGEWQSALETLETSATLESHPEALLLRARLLTDRAGRLDEARETWEKLLSIAGGDPRYTAAARRGMADWLFASGRLDEAERAYAELAGEDAEDGPPGTPLSELPPLPPGMLPPGGGAPQQASDRGGDPARAALRLAEISLRRRDLEEARERFGFVAQEYAQTEHANDALQRLAFIRENLDGEGSAEARYVEAIKLRDRGDTRMARDLLLEIAGTRGEPLADDALADLAELRCAQGDLSKAADTWLSLVERFPESMHAPGALLEAAALMAGRLDDAAGARNALRRIVEDYPASAAATEAQARLELLPPPRS